MGFAGTDHYLQVATNWREVDVGSEDTNIADERLESATSARASKNSLIGYGGSYPWRRQELKVHAVRLLIKREMANCKCLHLCRPAKAIP